MHKNVFNRQLVILSYYSLKNNNNHTNCKISSRSYVDKILMVHFLFIHEESKLVLEKTAF